jgi:protein ImuB
LRLIPDGVLVHLGLQPGLWGDAGAERERAHRALSRVQGLLGPDAVVTPVLSGGRSADDQIRLVPWGDERVPDRPTAEHADPYPGPVTAPVLPRAAEESGEGRAALTVVTEAGVGEPRTREERDGRAEGEERAAEGRVAAEGRAVAAGRVAAEGRAAVTGTAGVIAGTAPGVDKDLPPWPGRLPKPSPAVVLHQPLPAMVLDADGVPVGVSARLEPTGDPAVLLVGNGAPVEIVGWAGPWPVDERWWAPAEARRRARFQIGVADGRAFLITLSGGHWAIEAIYD